MLLIEGELQQKEDGTIILISSKRLRKGTIIHIDETGFDRVYISVFVKKHGLEVFFINYGSYNSQNSTFYFYADNARFIAHSYRPNTVYDKKLKRTVAKYTIEPGDEISWDYREFSYYRGL